MASSVVLISTAGVGLGAAAVNKQGAAVLAEVVRDPLAVFGQRSPGERRPGALFQTKRAKPAPLAVVAPPTPAPVMASALAPPFSDAADERLCERLTTPVSTAALAPVSPEVERVAGPLVAAVQQALANHRTSAESERQDAVEQAIEHVLDSTGATPAVARSALDVAQARLAALGVNCAPGVPQAMQVASVAVTQATSPSDLQPASITPPNPPAIGVPPFTGGGGGGGSTTHPPAQ